MIFNEDKLQAEIIKTWGEFGVHNEVFQAMRKKISDKKQLTLTDVVRTLVCVDGVLPNLTEGKEYEMLEETNRHYNLIDDNGNDVLIGKSYMRELKQAN